MARNHRRAAAGRECRPGRAAEERVMRTLLAALGLVALTVATGLAPAGDKKEGKEADKGKGITYPVSGKDAVWYGKQAKNPNHWDVGQATLDEKNPGQIAFGEAKG